MSILKYQIIKRYFKFLVICNNPKIIAHIIKSSPAKLIEIICNAAVNIYCGDIILTKSQKNLFAKSRSIIRILSDKNTSLSNKRKILARERNQFILNAIISICFKSFGNKIFK